MDELIYWVWLANLSGLKKEVVKKLLENMTPCEIYHTDFSNYREFEMTKTSRFVLNNKDLGRASEVILKIQALGARIVTMEDEEYPKLLKEIYFPPIVLYVKGERIDWDNILPVAVVGTRDCTDYGIKAGTIISKEIAKAGITIVSGMARGIDSVAGSAALSVGAKTIAVLGCGIDVVYPPENKDLMEAIIENGQVMTEYPPGAGPEKHHFPERNRIISGLSRGVLVVEAPERSGALITANYSYDENRDVFSIPGSIFKETQVGCNRLILSGAKPVLRASDIIEEYEHYIKDLGIKPVEKKEKVVPKITVDDKKYGNLPPDEKKIISILIEKDTRIEDIINKVGKPYNEIKTMLSFLEMDEMIVKKDNGEYGIKDL